MALFQIGAGGAGRMTTSSHHTLAFGATKLFVPGAMTTPSEQVRTGGWRRFCRERTVQRTWTEHF
jgi:hypothetical protein